MTNELLDERSQRVLELLEQFDDAMLVTRRNDGELHARPMHIGHVDDKGTVYFLSPLDTQKVDEILDHADCTAVMQQPGMFLSLNGTCRIRQDEESLETVASGVGRRTIERWMNNGDHNVVIEMTPHAAEYWAVRGPEKIRNLFSVAKNAIDRDVIAVSSSTDHDRVPINQ